MKKTLAILAVVGLAAGSVLAQGTIATYTLSSSFETHTNTTIYNTSLNGVNNTSQGFAPNVANGFYYALLYQTYTGSLSTIDPTSGNWSLGMMATNFAAAGGIRGAGGSTGSGVTGWAAPTDATYATAAEKYYLLVGWSANLGNNWAAVESQVAANTFIAQGLFGTSALGYSFAGGGPNSLVAVNIFGVSPGAPGGLANGITLFTTPIPEPGTMALAALGGAAMLMFRRRK